MHLVNFVYDNPITIGASGSGHSAIVADTSKLNGVTKGQGVLVFRYGPSGSRLVSNWTNRFVMNEETLVDSLNGQFPDGVCNVELPDPDSCSGFVTSNMEGFIVASAILLKFRDRRDIVIMLLFPKRDAPKIALAKKELSISGGKIEAQVFLTANEGIEYSGTITGTGFKKAELILTRRPNCQLIQQRYSQVLAEKKDQGTFGSSWMPVSRAFDDILVVFRPSEIHDYDLEKIFRLIGAEDDAFRGQKNSSFIIGDGRGTSYTLSLVLDRSLRREMMDETIITLT